MKTCIRKKSHENCNITYGSRFSVVSVLCRTEIYRLANKFRRTDSSLKSDTAVCLVSETVGDNEGPPKCASEVSELPWLIRGEIP